MQNRTTDREPTKRTDNTNLFAPMVRVTAPVIRVFAPVVRVLVVLLHSVLVVPLVAGIQQVYSVTRSVFCPVNSVWFRITDEPREASVFSRSHSVTCAAFKVQKEVGHPCAFCEHLN